MLSGEQTIEYLRKAKAGDGEAKEILLLENVSLLKCIVKRYLGKGVEYDDLFQLAGLGFLKAIAGFDESFGVKFSTYAVPMIAGEIKRFMRDDGSVKVSRSMKQTAKEMNTFVEEYLREKGVQSVFHYIPLHTSPMGKELGCDKSNLPVTEEYADRLLRLPLHAELTESDVAMIIEKVKEVL